LKKIKRQIKRQVAFEISHPLGLLGLFVLGGAVRFREVGVLGASCPFGRV